MKIVLLFLLTLCVCLPSCYVGQKNSPSINNQVGTIVLLNGTSSAGKSSVIKELQKIYGDTFRSANIDEFEVSYLADPEHEFGEAMFVIFYEHIKKLAMAGKNVLVDTVGYDHHYEKFNIILGYGRVIKILVYCPIDILVDRVEERNKSGASEEKRNLQQAVSDFPVILKLQESADEVVVDRISSSRIMYALQVAKKELEGIKKDFPQEVIDQMESFYKKFEQYYGLDKEHEVVFVPRHSWDLIVNTGINSPSEVAKTIARYLTRYI